jgi:ankyrin repeat protein
MSIASRMTVCFAVCAAVLNVPAAQGQRPLSDEAATPPASTRTPIQLMGKSPEQAFGRAQDAALARASAEGNIAALDRAVKAGADVNALDHSQSSPLIWAMTHNREASVLRLLELRADPNQRLAREYTPLYLATTPAYSADVLAVLLKYGGDANYRVGKNTALMNSVRDLEKVKLLLAHGADVNYVDDFGDSALQFAADLDEWATVSNLIEHGWRGDLTRVARFAQRSRVRASWAVADLERAKQLMERHGIRFPVPERGLVGEANPPRR